MTSDLVSVVIPTFNRAYCLPETIESVLAQTYTNFEILIVDDGSTDGTADLVKTRWWSEPRVRYLFQPNRGLSAARNAGILEARGAFVAFLDSDDWWVPWKLDVQLACMAQYPMAVMIHSDCDLMDATGHVYAQRAIATLLPSYARFSLGDLYSYESRHVRDFLLSAPDGLGDMRVHYGDPYPYMIFGNLMMVSSVMLRRDSSASFERFNEALRVEEAPEFHRRVCRKGPALFLDATTFFYQRGREDHLWQPGRPVISTLAHEMNRGSLRMVESLLRSDRSRITLPKALIQLRLADAHAWVAGTAIQVGNRGEAIRHLARSLRFRFWQPRCALMLAAIAILPLGAISALRSALEFMRKAARSSK